MKFPNTVDKNLYLGYIRKEVCQRKFTQCLDAISLNWDLNYPETLVELCIKVIAENWGSEYKLLPIIFTMNLTNIHFFKHSQFSQIFLSVRTAHYLQIF
jgi:hypothetical protein